MSGLEKKDELDQMKAVNDSRLKKAREANRKHRDALKQKSAVARTPKDDERIVEILELLKLLKMSMLEPISETESESESESDDEPMKKPKKAKKAEPESDDDEPMKKPKKAKKSKKEPESDEPMKPKAKKADRSKKADPKPKDELEPDITQDLQLIRRFPNLANDFPIFV